MTTHQKSMPTLKSKHCRTMHSTGYIQPHKTETGSANSTFFIQHKGMLYKARSTVTKRQPQLRCSRINGNCGKIIRDYCCSKEMKPCLNTESRYSGELRTNLNGDIRQISKEKHENVKYTCKNTPLSDKYRGLHQARERPNTLDLGFAGLVPSSQRQNYRPGSRLERLEQRKYRITKWSETDELSFNSRTENFETRLHNSDSTSLNYHKASNASLNRDYSQTEQRRIRALRNMEKMKEMLPQVVKDENVSKTDKLQTTDSGIWCGGGSENNNLYSKPNVASKLITKTNKTEITPISNLSKAVNKTLPQTSQTRNITSHRNESTSKKESRYQKQYSTTSKDRNKTDFYSPTDYDSKSTHKKTYNSSFHRISSDSSLTSSRVKNRHRNSVRSDYYRRKHRETYDYTSDDSETTLEQNRSYRTYKSKTKTCRFEDNLDYTQNSPYSRSKTFSNYPLQQTTYGYSPRQNFNTPQNYPQNTTNYVIQPQPNHTTFRVTEKQLVKIQPKSLHNSELSNYYNLNAGKAIIYQCACGECRKLYSFPSKVTEKPHVKFNTKRTRSEQSMTSITSGDDDSLSSGGSDTGSCGGEEGDGEEEAYVEHGEGVSVDGDSDGGDSGSDSGGDVSLNSAELFDDQNNLFDIKTALGGEDESDDGPGSAGSDCSDSLTELRSRSNKGSGSSDGEGDRDTITDDDDFDDSWDSLAIFERE